MHLEAVRDHFGCIQALSSVDGIVSDPWSGACDRMCFILKTTFIKRYYPSPFIYAPACWHAVLISVECVGFFLWALAGLPSLGYHLPLGSSDFRWALSWESSYYPPGMKETGSEHAVRLLLLDKWLEIKSVGIEALGSKIISLQLWF